MSYQPEPFVFVCCFCGDFYERNYTVFELGWSVDLTPSCRICRAKFDVKERDKFADQYLINEWERRFEDPSLRDWLVGYDCGSEWVKKE